MINSLRLQGFKNFRDATLPIGPLTVIVGTNASGKSNLRDAFRFLHGISRGYSLADIVGEKYVEGVLQWRGIRGGAREIATFGESGFSLEAMLPWWKKTGTIPLESYRYHVGVETSQAARPLRVMQESLERSGQMVFELRPSSNPPTQEGAEHLLVRVDQNGTQRVDGPAVSFLADQPVLTQLAFQDAVSSTIQRPAANVINHFRSMRFLDLSPEAMKVPAFPGQPLGDRGENLSSALQTLCEDDSRKRAVTEWIRQLTPLDVVDFEFVSDQTGRILLTLVESNGQRTSAYSASDGTLRFLAMIAALMGPDAAQFYFLEEIDNGIHPTRLNLLLQMIEQHARQRRLQVVTTTHSPQLLAMLSPEAREHAHLVYRLENETEAHIQRILDIPTAKEVLAKQNFARLHESGWLENMVAFTRPEGDEP